MKSLQSCSDAGEAAETLRSAANEGLKHRTGTSESSRTQGAANVYVRRLELELDHLIAGGKSAYFLAVAACAADLRARGIMPDPGVGAAPSSLVLFALGVTDVDPVRHDLIFERFFSPEQTAALNVTFHIAPESVRDAVAGFIARNRPCVAEIAIAPRIREALARDLVTEIGAVGFVWPLFSAERAHHDTRMPSLDCVQFHGLAAPGNVWAAAKNAGVDLNVIGLDDPATYDLLSNGNCSDVFALAHPGARDHLRRIGPRCFEDLTAAIALDRPGPIEAGLFEAFVGASHGRSLPPNPVMEIPAVADVLRKTYGLVIYQEQIIEILSAVAGYAPGFAELLRRKIVRRNTIAGDFAVERRQFLEKTTRHSGTPVGIAGNIFDLLVASVGLAFNRSHAVATALLCYWNAWLERHHPRAFVSRQASGQSEVSDHESGGR